MFKFKRERTMKKILLSAALLSSGLTLVGSANATTATSTLDVSANIISACTAATAPVSFGNVVSGSGASASGSVDVTCDAGVPYTIALDVGQYDDGSSRRISDGTNFLSYTLVDNGTSTDWGDGTTFGGTVAGTGTGAAVNHVVDATLTGAAVPNGTYSDTVNVTVTY